MPIWKRPAQDDEEELQASPPPRVTVGKDGYTTARWSKPHGPAENPGNPEHGETGWWLVRVIRGKRG